MASRKISAPKKRRYSTWMCAINFADGILEIKGRKFFITVIMLAFAGLCFYLLTQEDMPWPVQAGMVLTIAICAWGFIDVGLGECYAHFDTRSRTLRVRRGSPFNRTDFTGMADGVARVEKKRSMRTRGVPRYQVVLLVELDRAIVHFPLQTANLAEEDADERVQYWREQLGLTNAA